MNKECIKTLYENKSINVEIEAGITVKIKEDVFRPGTVRVHLPAPINASWLKEGRLIDSEPMFRMMSVEDYPQRSAYFNEIMSENTPFSIVYAFNSEHTYTEPDISLIDHTPQKSFAKEEIAKFSAAGHCGCESYTALPFDRVTIKDVAGEKGLKFKDSYKHFLKKGGIDTDTTDALKARGTLARKIYDLIVNEYTATEDETLNMAFVSMCRMCGIPARWQGGWAMSDQSESPSAPDMSKQPAASGMSEASKPGCTQNAVSHDWALIHLLPYGWIYVDCEFAKKAGNEKIPGTDILLKDYFFGNIDPCMVPTASAPSADLYPAKDYPRADEIFNTRGEVELIPDKMTGEGHYDGYGLNCNEFESAVIINVLNIS
ncbi:MAG: transglutaminase domain-containing protein [Lachnospiraceae bacterium]|nr:transglutaminase domain-containing protein [Lachnospiraceae bacterium]